MKRTSPARGIFETRAELEAAILTDWGEGPPWKQGKVFSRALAEKYGISRPTVERILKDHENG